MLSDRDCDRDHSPVLEGGGGSGALDEALSELRCDTEVGFEVGGGGGDGFTFGSHANLLLEVLEYLSLAFTSR